MVAVTSPALIPNRNGPTSVNGSSTHCTRSPSGRTRHHSSNMINTLPDNTAMPNQWHNSERARHAKDDEHRLARQSQ